MAWQRPTFGPPSAAVRVMYLGDSMVEGRGRPGVPNFVELLSVGLPDWSHENAGANGTAGDTHLAFLNRLPSDALPTHLVLFVFPNDLDEFGDDYSCCDAGPLFAIQDGAANALCGEIRWVQPLSLRLHRSPAPYALILASLRSQAARHALLGMAHRFGHRARAAQARQAFDPAVAAATMIREIAAWADAHEIRLVVVALPDRPDLEATQDGDSVGDYHRTVLSVIRAAGIEPLDPWPMLHDAVRDPPAHLWTDLSGPTDVHFGADGHALMAQWLATELLSRWGGAPGD